MGIKIKMRVYYYKTDSGRSPVIEYIESLTEAEQARFFDVFTEIEKSGLDAARVAFKPLAGKLWEIKFSALGGGYRILYVLMGKESMVWLHAFKKKTQKTPARHLNLALKRLKEVMS